jgi:hypothetical protein
MNLMSVSMNVDPVAITLTREEPPTSVVTTLYDLIAAIQDVVDPDDDALVVATLRYILETRAATWRPSTN